MYPFLWFVFIGFIAIYAFPIFIPKYRTKWNVIRAIVITATIILGILAIEVLHIAPLIIIILVIIITFLADKSTYTKKGAIVTGIIFALIIAGAYYLFHDDPDFVQQYIDNNPEYASMYVSVDGEIIKNEQGDVKRPLASTVKTIIAIEYANQVVEGKVNPDEWIALDELEKFYLANSDGGAHPAWLDEMNSTNKIENEKVQVNEIAKGMIKFSSNANTDYLIEKLGADSINDVITDLDLKNHDPIYPIVSALLTSTYLNYQHDNHWSNKEMEAYLQSMSMEEYRALVWEIHDKIKQGGQEFNRGQFSVPMDLQRIWSDRLPNASAEDYGKIMQAISNNEATLPGGEGILREIMEWPMELHASNREMYAHFGAKGGSTAFVLNQALYVEDHKGKKLELVIFTEGLSIIEQIKMSRSINSFLIEVLEEHL